MPPTPSSIISDALSSLSKATNLALATVEDQARLDVSRANSEASEARRERDDALKAFQSLKLEEKEWERREEAWKAAVDKGELTVKHQAETIGQLRAEALQWKTQLLRLEETSRQEIADWKEQYLRAEQDRCRLSSRIDELVAEQLAWNTQANAALAPTTPRTPYPDFYAPSTSSTTTKRASTSVVPSLPKRATPLVQALNTEASQPQSVRKSKPAQTPSKVSSQSDRPAEPTPSRTPRSRTHPDVPSASTSKPPRPPHAARPSSAARNTPSSHAQAQEQAQAQPQQRVIRRVHAVISVPVKEEDDSEAEALESDAEGSAYEPDEEQPVRSRKSGRISAAAKGRQAQVWRDEDETDAEEEGEVEQSRPRRNRYVEDDSDVDELAMDAEDIDRYYPPNSAAAKNAQKPQRQNGARPSTAASGKKRKLDAETTTGTPGRATTVKVARKR